MPNSPRVPVNSYEEACRALQAAPRKFLVTGVAGFIGSNTAERLLHLGQRVVGLDNLSTGKQSNMDLLRKTADACGGELLLIEGDVSDFETCRKAMPGVDAIIHLAALGSVPRSIADPLGTHRSNVEGFVNMLVAAQKAGIRRFVYASSSSVYGDYPTSPKREEFLGQPLSPYAVTKLVNEQYASIFGRTYGIETIGFRYFNVFGPRQDPDGPYAAVIPRWIKSIQRSEPVKVFGDGLTSRDFCYVQNVVQANIIGATTPSDEAVNEVYNIAVGHQTSLNDLFSGIANRLRRTLGGRAIPPPIYEPFRPGDVRHSLADISKAVRLLGYVPSHRWESGLDETVSWFSEACDQP